MTSRHREIAEMLSNVMEAELDSLLVQQGFSREDGSLRYSRQVSEGTQILEIHFDTSPSYEPRAAAHILPKLSVILPDVNKVTVEIVGDARNLIASASTTFFQQLQNAAPRSVRTSATRWLVYDQESALSCVASMREFIQQWTIPFLSKYSTAKALTEGYEQHDECLPHDRRFSLFVVGAYLFLNDPAKAMHLLETKFGRPGTRRQYATVFEHVAKKLDNQQ